MDQTAEPADNQTKNQNVNQIANQKNAQPIYPLEFLDSMNEEDLEALIISRASEELKAIDNEDLVGGKTFSSHLR